MSQMTPGFYWVKCEWVGGPIQVSIAELNHDGEWSILGSEYVPRDLKIVPIMGIEIPPEIDADGII